jgi:hypothetical protein
MTNNRATPTWTLVAVALTPVVAFLGLLAAGFGNALS